MTSEQICRSMLVIVPVMLGGCIGTTASASCGFSTYAASPGPGETAPVMTEELARKYPELADALARSYDSGGTSACPNRPMMEDVLALGGTGRIDDDQHGFALLNASDKTWRIEWTFAPGGEV